MDNEFKGSDPWEALKSSGQSKITIGGVMWPVSQMRLGATTQYGVELFASKWLLRQRGMEAAAKSSHAFNALVSMKAENRRQGY